MALTSSTYKLSAKSKYLDEDGVTIKNRTITLMNDAVGQVDDDENIARIANRFQPLTTDTLTGEMVITRTKTYSSNITVAAGTDELTGSTKDQIIYKLGNAAGMKTLTIQNAASVDPTDTTKWSALTTAVNQYGTELTSYLDGDYSVDQVSLRAYTDYNFED